MLFENPVAAAKMFPYSVPPPIQGAAAVPVQNLRFVEIFHSYFFFTHSAHFLSFCITSKTSSFLHIVSRFPLISAMVSGKLFLAGPGVCVSA